MFISAKMFDMEGLKNKVALVTGAGSGLGKCVAELYAKNGTSVVLSDIDEKAGSYYPIDSAHLAG